MDSIALINSKNLNIFARFKSKLSFRRLSIALVSILLFFIFKNIFGSDNSAFKLDNVANGIVSSKDGPENIFFIDSSGMNSIGDVSLTIRQACSIESAALMNPNAKINVVFVTQSNMKRSSTIKTLMNYKNIVFHRVNFLEFVRGTPAEDWVDNGDIFNTKYLPNNICNLLRLLLLWRYGGTYLDTDVIVRRSIESIPETNYVCAQTSKMSEDNSINNAIINMQDEIGKGFAEVFVDDFMKHYNGHKWGHNGPNLITRILNKMCDANKIGNITEPISCNHFIILPPEKCYPIGFGMWQYFFEPKYTEQTMKLVENSYFVHIWNKLSKENILRNDSECAYIQLARKFCPETLKASDAFF